MDSRTDLKKANHLKLAKSTTKMCNAMLVGCGEVEGVVAVGELEKSLIWEADQHGRLWNCMKSFSCSYEIIVHNLRLWFSFFQIVYFKSSLFM